MTPGPVVEEIQEVSCAAEIQNHDKRKGPQLSRSSALVLGYVTLSLGTSIVAGDEPLP